MKTDLFTYHLPPELIAQTPADRRGDSRLLVYHRETGQVEHRRFRNITAYFRSGDLLVINTSRVIPARLFTIEDPAVRKPAEVLFLRQIATDRFWALVRPGRRFKIGSTHVLPGGVEITVSEISADGARLFTTRGIDDCVEVFRRHGEMPLPPYITSREAPPDRYQTVFAREEGSIAAPTAGLHFDSEILETLRAGGVTIATVLLHVGLGTFKPIETADLDAHPMHEESYFVSAETAAAFADTRRAGGRVWACGTTSIRTLESAYQPDGTLRTGWGATRLFITPGYSFRAADRFITNFHLPQSTLLVLVSAICGREKTLELYETAIAQRYRFFSFGDCMGIL
jgi:S-adenosylmethionine:tRNA ribosyltransferase-isomerase